MVGFAESPGVDRPRTGLDLPKNIIGMIRGDDQKAFKLQLVQVF